MASGALLAGIAAYQFLVKSRPEKIYKAYLEESQVKPTPRLAFSLGPPAGYELDHASVTDLDPEFRLSGPIDPTAPNGLGTITIDATQAPVYMTATGKFRYWLTGSFAGTGDVLLTYLPGTWSYAKTDAYTDAPIVELNDTSVYVTFPADTNGYAIDPNSVLDLADEFTVTLVRTYDITTSGTTELIVDFPRGTYDVDPASL